MTPPTLLFCSRASPRLLVLLLCFFFVLTTTSSASVTYNVPPPVSPPQLLQRIMYAWVGGNGQPDYVAVIDFDVTSLNYGKVLSRHPLPSNVTHVSPINNEPHHAGIDKQRKLLLVGGLLSFIQQTHEIFVFDISNPFEVMMCTCTFRDTFFVCVCQILHASIFFC